MSIISVFFALLFWGIPIGLLGYVVYKIVNKGNPAEINPLADRFSSINFPDHIKAILALLLIGYNLFAYQIVLGIGTGLMFSTVLLISYLAINKSLKTNLDLMVLAIGLFAALFIGVRANGTVQGINILIASVAVLLLIMRSAVGYINWQGIWLIKRLFEFGWYSVRNAFTLPAYQRNHANESKINVWSTIKIIFFTLVVVFFFAEILSGADPVFAELIEDIKEEALTRTFVSLFILTIATVVFSVRLMPKPEETLKIGWLSFSEAFVPVLATEILFLLFIFVQAKYLFGGHADLAHFDLSYSEYARKGFYELLIVSFFGGLIAYVLIVKQRVIEIASKVSQLKVLNVVLIMELFFMLASALKRDLLYVDAFGLTRTRFIGGAFLLWLAVALGLLLVMNIWHKTFSEKKFFAGIGVATVGMMLFFNIFNIDKYIALSEPPSDFHNAREYYYINSLSEDAIDGWEESVTYVSDSLDELLTVPVQNEEQLVNSKLAMIALKEKRDALYAKYGTRDEAAMLLYPYYSSRKVLGDEMDEPTYDDLTKYERDRIRRIQKWQSFNVSEYAAYQRMVDNPEIFETQVNCIIRSIEEFQYENEVDSYQLESKVLYQIERPFLTIQQDYYPKSYTTNTNVNKDFYHENDYRIATPPQLINNEIEHSFLTSCSR